MDGQLQRWRRVIATGAILLFVFTAPGAAPSDQLFPPQSTVVLLSGVPGDLETENSYRDQLQTWLEIVQSAGRVENLFVLSDNPESLDPAGFSVTNKAAQLPPTQFPSTNRPLPLTVLHADRTNFLSIARRSAGQTNALLVIAWGHGGKQGATPVFHVRGPRLTSADFKAFADQLPAQPSRWILFFRGSGAFAAQLAGPQREVLSSENETIFTSDPIGMTVLLKILRSNASISFESLAQQFGPATVAWYNERNLARTEEPTLWLPNAKPKLLAALAGNIENTALASVKPEPTNSPASPPPGPNATPVELPASWKEVKRVAAQDYPEADAVILRRRISYTLGSNPAISSEQDEFLQILTVEGKRFGDFDISFSPPFEDINFLDCEVLSPAGKLARLDPDAIREAREESVGDYQTGRRKFFSLPGVVPGAVLHVRYRTQWKDFPLPHVSLRIPIEQEVPALQTTVEISIPKSSPFHFAFESDFSRLSNSTFRAPDPLIKQTAYSISYTWRLEDRPAHEQEILSPPPANAAGLIISTFPDWPAFADWYGRISKLTDEVTPELAAKAAELTRAAKRDRDKVLALYDYVTRLRYVAVPLGVNSFRPHAAANVFQNQFGDCKDKANLFNTLLHALKIDAHLVLVPRFSQAHETIPGFAFNHAISRVVLGSETYWVDTTDDVCRFGLLPPGDSGRKVLIIDGTSNALTQLPLPQSGDHQLKIHGEIDCSHPTDPLPADVSAVALGFPDYELRATARESREHRGSLPLLSSRFRPVGGSFALEKQSATSVAALDENFSWKASGTFVALCTRAYQSTNQANRHSFSLRAPFWLPKEWDSALQQRKSALYLNQGYPLTLEEDLEFRLPPNAEVGPLSGTIQNSENPLRWRMEWVKLGHDKLAAHLSAEMVHGELSAAETPLFQTQLRALLAALASPADFSFRDDK